MLALTHSIYITFIANIYTFSSTHYILFLRRMIVLFHLCHPSTMLFGCNISRDCFLLLQETYVLFPLWRPLDWALDLVFGLWYVSLVDGLPEGLQNSKKNLFLLNFTTWFQLSQEHWLYILVTYRSFFIMHYLLRITHER